MKILSLDGGGSWALLEARCLLDLYGDMNGNELLQKFDLVISNSGGSIVLACLIENMKLSDIVKWFLNANDRNSVFSKLTIFDRSPLMSLLRLEHIGPKYSAAEKLVALENHLPNRGGCFLSELPALIGKPSLQLIICAFDYERNREVFFRSNMKSKADARYYSIMAGMPVGAFADVTLAEAVHGSSNAPVNYFDKPALVRYRGDTFDRQFWDGAIGGFNNPVFAGVTEAIANGEKLEDLRILSIGTGTNLLPLYNDQDPKPTVNTFMYQQGHSTFVNDIEKISGSIVADPPDSASFHAYNIIHSGLPAPELYYLHLTAYFGLILSFLKIRFCTQEIVHL